MNNYKNFIFDSFDCDLWSHLKTANKPILIYGQGNGADKIIDVLEKNGIYFSDIFASDGFVRNQIFHKKTVISYSRACELYGNDFIILISFGTHLSGVMDRIYELDKKHEVYAPDVPVFGTELFDKTFFDAHRNELYSARELFDDEKSKEVFDNTIRAKLTGKLSFLKKTESNETEEKNILRYDSYISYADMGAYNGDTVRKYLDLCKNIKEIYAFEPDSRNFKKLNEYSQSETRSVVKPFNFASWDREETLSFFSSGNRNSTRAGSQSHQFKKIEVTGMPLDNVIEKAHFIKYDVEGEELRALTGSRRIITNYSPDLLVSMYHRSEDMYILPKFVKSLCPEYKLYLRRYPYIPAWDLNLYAIK